MSFRNNPDAHCLAAQMGFDIDGVAFVLRFLTRRGAGNAGSRGNSISILSLTGRDSVWIEAGKWIKRGNQMLFSADRLRL